MDAPCQPRGSAVVGGTWPSSYCGSPSSMCHQLLLEPTYACQAGCTGSGSLMSPARIRTTPGTDVRRLYKGDPHRLQKSRCLPGDDSYDFSNCSPASKRKADAATGMFAANGPPCALRHWTQWQI